MRFRLVATDSQGYRVRDHQLLVQQLTCLGIDAPVPMLLGTDALVWAVLGTDALVRAVLGTNAFVRAVLGTDAFVRAVRSGRGGV